jgi:hypothetical protein
MSMTTLSNVTNKWPIVRLAVGVTFAFCCTAPLVWLVSNLLVYGVRLVGY